MGKEKDRRPGLKSLQGFGNGLKTAPQHKCLVEGEAVRRSVERGKGQKALEKVGGKGGQVSGEGTFTFYSCLNVTCEEYTIIYVMVKHVKKPKEVKKWETTLPFSLFVQDSRQFWLPSP